MVLKVIRLLLNADGKVVLTAESEDEAIQIAERERGPINFLLSDVRLGQGSGPGIAQRLRDSHPEAKVLFMSGYSQNILEELGLLNPEDAFLPKPFDTKAFRSALMKFNPLACSLAQVPGRPMVNVSLACRFMLSGN